jgi:hypothetical protein
MWYIFSRFGMLYQEQFGNSALEDQPANPFFQLLHGFLNTFSDF